MNFAHFTSTGRCAGYASTQLSIPKVCDQTNLLTASVCVSFLVNLLANAGLK